MQTRFLLGPAGSGKTRRCLGEIQRELRAAPDGLPLLLLAPKQATFQLERQLLEEGVLSGYTRLQILSFDRLAQFLVDELTEAPAQLLDEEGRVMVLRALLNRHCAELRLFHATARLPGFARQLSEVLRELQQHQVSPARLTRLAEKPGCPAMLAGKLVDLARLLEASQNWLQAHHLQDGGSLLELATQTVRQHLSELRFGGLWMDGFAEMTPQELDLLAALLPRCEQSTLAFCLESAPRQEVSWLSTWSVVSQTFRQCHQRVVGLGGGIETAVEVLSRDLSHSRFSDNPVLAHLERHWAQPSSYHWDSDLCASTEGCHETPRTLSPSPPLRIVLCANPEAEAVCAAREILRYVRESKENRFRDVAVLVRSLDSYHHVLRRVFTRYGIPHFLDRREPVTHHPLAELTRCALRMAAFGWRHPDWFGALKTGLVPAAEEEIDQLENEALSKGWEGSVWRQFLPSPSGNGLSEALETPRPESAGPATPPPLGPVSSLPVNPVGDDVRSQLMNLTVPSLSSPAPPATRGERGTPRFTGSPREFSIQASLLCARLLPPFLELEKSVAAPVSGKALAHSLEKLWQRLGVEPTLESWSAPDPRFQGSPQAIGTHTSVWSQMQQWLENLALAFPTEEMRVAEWLPILEAGLSSLTVGSIPPALDQVLVGAIDRSRNPELQLALILGLNEGVFPAPPHSGVLLTESDRAELETHQLRLGPSRRQRLGHERYYGYIACTRARQRLILTHAAATAEGQPLNPSPFLGQLQAMFSVKPDLFPQEVAWSDSEHAGELMDALVRLRQTPQAAGVLPVDLLRLPGIASVLKRADDLTLARRSDRLSSPAVAALYRADLRVSVSALENYAACPFRFFIDTGLRGSEREEFEAGFREEGSFQHTILSEFHHKVRQQKKQWRDLSPLAAAELVREIGEALIPAFGQGVFAGSAGRRFRARMLIVRLAHWLTTIQGWMPNYRLNPFAVELAFGQKDSPLPGWPLELEHGGTLTLRGRIDRVDLAQTKSGEAVAVVIDYKSSGDAFDAVLLQHGLELQLFSYLAFLRQLNPPRPLFDEQPLIPAGVFYANLRGTFKGADSRTEVSDDPSAARKAAYQHRGRFDKQFTAWLDSRPKPESPQFMLSARSSDPMESAEFTDHLARVETHLRTFGAEILNGRISIDPYRKGGEKACDHCELAGICRFDPWNQPYRVLRAPPKSEKNSAKLGKGPE